MQKKSKKTPQRRCVGCYESKNKMDLIRIVRTPEGEYKIDPSGKLSGRGAYICPSMACFEKAVKSRGLERSFKMSIPNEVYDSLEKEFDEENG